VIEFKPDLNLNMAEIFGAVASALSVAALFKNCVDCFEYIQLGRNFGQEYEKCQLKLDIVRLRLGRWGEAVNIDDARFATDTPTDQTAELAKSILEQIFILFQSAQKTSKRYEATAKSDTLVLLEDHNMASLARRLHNRLQDLGHQRQGQTSLVRKASWALYDGKKFEKLIDDIKDFIDDLENLIPVEAVCRGLAELEIEEVDDEPTLQLLGDVAGGIDMALLKAVKDKVDRISTRNYAKDINTEDCAKVRLGDEVSEAVRDMLIRHGTTNTAETVTARGDSRVHIGNKFGGKGVLDD